ncbi:LysR family transcriptional regulator [Aestuariivirga sp.]|uniref:LysR family transcriptional regulator n=1 Tax=Aestuariivirga sp. TaxID=2650926 RepID=UPI003594554F
MFEWSDLRYLLGVHRHGSTVAAARKLGVSQSTVHRRLAELERRIGMQLVTRHPTGYRLTEIGNSLIPHAERVEEAVLAFSRRIETLDRNVQGLVRVTCPEPLVPRLTRSPLLARFAQRYPGVHIEFVMSDRMVDLAAGEADIAIRAGEPKQGELICRKLSDSPWGVYASRTYITQHGRPDCVADLNRHLLIGFDGELSNHRAAQWLSRSAPDAKIAARSSSIPGLAYAARSGVGLAALPMAIGDEEAGLLCVLGPVPELSTSWYLMVHPDLRHSPRVAALFEFLIEEAQLLRSILLGRSDPTTSA